MTEREYKKRHIKLWDGVIDYLHALEKNKVKTYYKSVQGIKSALINTPEFSYGAVYACYACEFALRESTTTTGRCAKCPLIGKLGCACTDKYCGAYYLLTEAYYQKDYEKAAELAVKIRDVWREID